MSTARRDTLREIEVRVQKDWDASKVYDTDAPKLVQGQEKPSKFFVTFPYPYMNGKLHLGHCFSLSKSEFAARFWRMKGRQVLWPFGLHVTGTPIAACAQKLKNEIAKYGNPPVFPAEILEGKPAEKAELALGQHKSKRAKSGPPKPQWIIMANMGIPECDIPKFVDPLHWLNYFPGMAVDDLKILGCHIDYRRSFITTEVNPFYDSFVRWQFKQLRASGYLNYGKRYCIYSPLDGQPCADHDRATGEGAQPQEYIVVKLKVQDVASHPAFQPHLETIADREVIFPGATLRAETVVGQTNCWVSPNFNYKAYAVKTPSGSSQVFMMTERSARNMLFQDFELNGVTSGEVQPIFEIEGAKLIGIPLKAPHSAFDVIYTLPMASITQNKGTGVVMSVPSDSPDDYINFTTLMNKPDYRTKLGLKDEWVTPFAIVPIIDIPGEFGQESAKVACTKLKINGPKDADQLEEAKKMVYQAGFYSGVMTAGPFKGKKVSEAKVLMTQLMMENDECFRYYEPIKNVMSRSGDECVVALAPQWYIEYGKEEWKEIVKDHVNNRMDMYFPGIRHGFEETLNWLAEWPCSRTFGLGTKLPCDESGTMIIDSLSDSTIYMAYYSVSRFFHTTMDGSCCLDGSQPNKYGITPDMVTDATWDYILKGKGSAEELNSATGLPVEVAKEMHGEFDFWYPVDLRVSAKDLIQNHLTMFLYNHAAIWPEDKSKWPQSIYCNGHIQVDNEKMAKSLGNFIMLREAVETYGADATRLACADAGDSMDDANFVRETAGGFIMKLTTAIESATEHMSKMDTFREGEFTLFDKIFNNIINNIIVTTDNYYSRMSFRMALNTAFHEFTTEWSQYRVACEGNGLHKDLVKRYFEVFTLLMQPLAPHFAEHMWQGVLGNTGSAVTTAFPTPSAPVDYALQVSNRVINDVIGTIRSQATKNKKKGPVEVVYAYLATTYLSWQKAALTSLRAIYSENNKSFPADTTKLFMAKKDEWMSGSNMQDAMAFAAFVRANTDKYGEHALDLEPAANDMDVLNSVKDHVIKQSGVPSIIFYLMDDETIPEHKVARGKARPGEPSISFPPQKKK